MKIWEPKPPGTLWATPGLLWDSSRFNISLVVEGTQKGSCTYSTVQTPRHDIIKAAIQNMTLDVVILILTIITTGLHM